MFNTSGELTDRQSSFILQSFNYQKNFTKRILQNIKWILRSLQQLTRHNDNKWADSSVSSIIENSVCNQRWSDIKKHTRLVVFKEQWCNTRIVCSPRLCPCDVSAVCPRWSSFFYVIGTEGDERLRGVPWRCWYGDMERMKYRKWLIITLPCLEGVRC